MSMLLKRLNFFTIVTVTAFFLTPLSLAESPAKASDATDPDRVSKLLDKFREKKTLDSGKKEANLKQDLAPKTKPETIIVAPDPIAIKQRPRKFVKRKPKSVKTQSTKPTKYAAKSISSGSNIFHDALHKIYIRGDYGMGLTYKRKLIDENPRKPHMYGGGIGYRINEVLRTDINVQRRKIRLKPRPVQVFDKVNATTVLFNAYLNLMDETSHMIPFFMAGIGYSENKVKDFSDTLIAPNLPTVFLNTSGKTVKNMAWNIGAGIELNLTKNISIELNYKYLDIGKIELYTITSSSLGSAEGNPKGRVRIHEVAGGLILNL